VKPSIGTAGFGALLGLWFGYEAAGLGGAAFLSVVVGTGGFVVGAAVDGTFQLLARAMRALLPHWWLLLAVGCLVAFIVLTWGLRL
jgi:hypothetical protein